MMEVAIAQNDSKKKIAIGKVLHKYMSIMTTEKVASYEVARILKNQSVEELINNFSDFDGI